MKDRVVFDHTVLPNGITIYEKPADVPFVAVRLFFPVGSVNNTKHVLPGSAHFLEHMVCRRSRKFPEPDSFKKYVSFNGGSTNAVTTPRWTEYELTIPSEAFAEVFPAFIEHISNPLLEEEYARHESRIIESERRRRSKWYPGRTKLGYHTMTEWKYSGYLSLQQIFVDKSDLETMTVKNLKTVHEAYFDPRIHMFIGGSFESDILQGELDKLQTKKHTLGEEYSHTSWTHREYHEEKCSQSQQFIYHLGGILDSTEFKVDLANKFLGDMLVNVFNGTLYGWLRNTLGWSYDMGFQISHVIPTNPPNWELWLPVQNKTQVQTVRKAIHERIQNTIKDQNLIHIELKRKKAKRVFWYQTVDEILNDGANCLHYFGHVISETEWVQTIEEVANPTYLQKIYQKYWSPEVSGEFLALPEDA